MARLPRLVIPNQPLHIMHRGNNRQDIFESEEDMIRIKEDISYALEKSGCHLHAYVVMTNHLHLLITPDSKEQLAVFMQAMANKYVRYFNAKHQRTGTIWEGRYKSCLVDSEQYLFTLYKYIEMNPIYQALGRSIEARCEGYKALFDGLDLAKHNERITQATERGEAYGSDAFHQRLEIIISRPTRLVGHGGDRKSEIYRNQAG